MNENIYLCSFYDTSLTPSAKRLKMQSKEFNIFKDKLVPSRGFGYWVWNPYIILETMKKLDHGDILLYVDTGCHIAKNTKSMKRFSEII